jgi:hypothetical protein
MFTPDQIPDIEQALRRAGHPLSFLYEEADIDPSMWWRWKRKAHAPSARSWRRVQAALDRLRIHAEAP